MKLQELTFDERLTIYGGSEASESLMYWLGAGCKYLYLVACYNYDYGVTYAINASRK